MRRKILQITLVALIMLTPGSGAFAVDIFFIGGAGGGGGASAQSDGLKSASGGKAGASVNGGNANTSNDAGKGGSFNYNSGGTGISGKAQWVNVNDGDTVLQNSGLDSADDGEAATVDGNDGGKGEDGGSVSNNNVNLGNIDGTAYFLGGNGGSRGMDSAGKGGLGGKGGSVSATLSGDALVFGGNIVIMGGNSGRQEELADTVGGGIGGDVRVDYRGSSLTLHGTATMTIASGSTDPDESNKRNPEGSTGGFYAENTDIILDDAIIEINNAKTSELEPGGDATFKVGSLSAGGNGGKLITGGILHTDGDHLTKRIISIGAVNAVNGNMELALNDIVDKVRDEVSLGKITIGDGINSRSLTISNGVHAQNFNWSGGLSVKGKDNTISDGTSGTLNPLDATGITGSKFEFDLTGVDIGNTMLIGKVVADVNTTAALTNATVVHLGKEITLIENIGSAGFLGDHIQTEKVGTSWDSKGNPATFRALVYNDGGGSSDGALVFYGNSFTAAGDWTEEKTVVLTFDSADPEISYTVGGTLTLPDKVDFKIAGDKTTIRIGNLNIEGASVVDFTEGSDVTIGNISMSSDSSLVFTAPRNSWSGNLSVTDSVTLAGLNLGGKSVTAIIDDPDHKFDVPLIVAGGDASGTLTVDRNTTTVTLNFDKSFSTVLQQPTSAISIFENDNTAIEGLAELKGKIVPITSGHYAGTGEFDDIGFVRKMLLRLDTGDTSSLYNAMLAVPAAVSLLNGGGDLAERMAGSFTPMTLRRDCRMFGVYAAMGGGILDVDVGSGIDLNNFHMLVGPGIRLCSGSAKTDFGAFFEAGWGGYDAYNGTHSGSGDSRYHGGGLLFRHDTAFGLYAEATARAGAAETDHASRHETDFGLKTGYCGGHIGLGYIFRPSEASSIDVSAKGLLTHMTGDKTTDESEYAIDIDSVNSVRTHLGVKYSHRFAPDANVFAKAVWEHEYNGRTGGSYDGAAVRRADMGGTSVIGEIGVDWKAAERLTIDASVYGIVGKRRGFGGTIGASLSF